MLDRLTGLSSLFSHRAFLLRRVARCALAEMAFAAGNILPHTLAAAFWSLALTLNPHHAMAALNRALALQADDSPLAWDAFEEALRAIENPQKTSASDLALTWVPGGLIRRAAARLLWGPGNAGLTEAHDRERQAALARLAENHFSVWIDRADTERAEKAWRVLQSVTGSSLEARWARAELDWVKQDEAALHGGIDDLVRGGAFLSPFDTLRWGERFLALAARCGQGEAFGRLADECLCWGREWLPDDGRLWRLLGLQANSRGDRDRARECYRRARRLNPEDVRTVLELVSLEKRQLEPWQETTGVMLRVIGPGRMAVGGQAQVECVLEGEEADWEVHALPPAGWGMFIEPRSQSVRAPGRCFFTVQACRPDRIRGNAWELVFLAVSGSSYCLGRMQIAVPDEQPGRLLVICTEDHEIQEERGVLAADELRSLLVDKSAFAGALFAPWTHMLEAGSTLFMPEWAGAQAKEWNGLARAIRDHIAAEVAAGNDVQAHYHAFNDPAAAHFPYRISGGGWSPDHRFLLTVEERRRNWAGACPPPNRSPDDPTWFRAPLDRLTGAERVVAEIEGVGRLGDPDYRAVLWRSGQLEFGSSTHDRAWSAAALSRAGLLADSDLRTRRSNRPAFLEAFAASAQDPFAPEPGGNLLQLPIWGNLEGDFLTDLGRLRALVSQTAAHLKDSGGALKPGVHLITLLTHDKFINARRGGDEARLDVEYGDWAVIGEHLRAWKAAGAERVTARQGVEAALDSETWRPVPLLVRETFVACDPNSAVRYSLRLLGAGIPISRNSPHDVLIRVPPLLRGSVKGIRACQGETVLAVENEGGHAFWLTLTSREPEVRCYFDLAASSGPRLESLEKTGEGRWRLTVSAPDRFLHAQLLLPWQLIGLARPTPRKDAPESSSDPDGLIVRLPPFERDINGTIRAQVVEVSI